MLKDKSFLAIIPARGKSQRLPHKNILPLAGKPLVVWSIDAARLSKYIDKVALSTDSEEIINSCRGTGIEIPFVRPDALSTDTATSFDVVEHAIRHYKSTLRIDFDYVILLQPTSPFRSAADIDGAIEFLMAKDADAVISVCPADHVPIWTNWLPDDLSMDGFLAQQNKNLNTQSFRKYFRLNGALYLCSIKKLLQEKTFFLKSNIYAFVMPKERSVDIDTQFDFQFAEFLVQQSDPEKKNASRSGSPA